MVNLLKIVVSLCTLVLLTACVSNARVQSDFKENLDFSQYETYNFRSVTAVENPGFPDLLGLIFSAAIEQQMLSRGYIKSDKPDILINVSVDVEEITRPPNNGLSCPSYADYLSRYSSKDFRTGRSDPLVCKYTDGAISIDIVDVNLNQSIWQGVSRVRIDDREKDREFFLKSNIVHDVGIMFEDSPFSTREQLAWMYESK